MKARYVGNRHLADACYLWAFSALTASPGARAYYDALRDANDDHDAASAGFGQPARRHPRRLPAPPGPLRRRDCLGPPPGCLSLRVRFAEATPLRRFLDAPLRSPEVGVKGGPRGHPNGMRGEAERPLRRLRDAASRPDS